MADQQQTDHPIPHLTAREHLRLRPGMYIGVRGIAEIHQMAEELLKLTLDEEQNGRISNVWVTVHAGDCLSIEDDGDGIPVSKDEGASTIEGRNFRVLEAMLTECDIYRRERLFREPLQVHIMARLVVNCLSKWCEVTTVREGSFWRQKFEEGLPVGPLERLNPTTSRGTRTSFKPDPMIFENTEFSSREIQQRLGNLSTSHPAVSFHFHDERTNEKQ